METFCVYAIGIFVVAGSLLAVLDPMVLGNYPVYLFVCVLFCVPRVCLSWEVPVVVE